MSWSKNSTKPAEQTEIQVAVVLFLHERMQTLKFEVAL